MRAYPEAWREKSATSDRETVATVRVAAGAISRKERNKRMSETDLEKQMAGYGLTTAEILYRLPDFPTLLQTYVWQDYDLHPRFPELSKFLTFWESKLDGPLFRVRVAHKELISPADMHYHDGELLLH